MGVFVAAAIVFGLAVVPRLVDYVGKQRSGEILIVTVLGMCFAMSYFAIVIGLSEAIGAVVMGVLISEAKFVSDVVRKVEPVRDLFGAIFFIAIGMLVDLSLFTDISHFIIPAIIVLIVFVIGEFSLMIASVAAGNESIRPEVYPMIVVVTTMTALIVSYSVKSTNGA